MVFDGERLHLGRDGLGEHWASFWRFGGSRIDGRGLARFFCPVL
ncbi:unnamed protein product [Arabidopsis thaliana]|uniref:(thale cress) hypothetical protein n=1 Tax=Arabidopsis thaliana TaxID=3702 RepID=A0A7G2E6L4_ARATH|nr:unnamed protein product [Arabidopsis thaliana]